MNNLAKNLLKYGISTLSAGGVTLLILWNYEFWDAPTLVERYRILANAFTIPGVILMMFAALIWVSADGFFDGLAYAFSQAKDRLIPFVGAKRKHETYYDFKQRKQEKRPRGYGFLFFVGAAFTLVAVIFTLLHGSVYVPMA